MHFQFPETLNFSIFTSYDLVSTASNEHFLCLLAIIKTYFLLTIENERLSHMYVMYVYELLPIFTNHTSKDIFKFPINASGM